MSVAGEHLFLAVSDERREIGERSQQPRYQMWANVRLNLVKTIG